MRRMHAFTLVELLVVISLIALLISMLLPSLGQARQTAMVAVCTSNMRQSGVACATYQTEFNYYLPIGYMNPLDSTGNYSNMAQPWYYVVDQYLGGAGLYNHTKRGRTILTIGSGNQEVRSGGASSAYACPSTFGKIRYTYGDPSDCFGALDVDYYYNGSYTGASFSGSTTSKWWYEAPKRNAATPSRVWLMTDGDSWRTPYVTYGSSVLYEFTGAVYPENIGNGEPRIKVLRHINRTSNYLFGDGHAESGWDWAKTNRHAWGSDLSTRRFWWRGSDRGADGNIPIR